MSSQSEEEEWESWEEEYSYMSSDIYQSIKKNSHLLDINDGHHAKWHEDQLGIMIVLPFEHAMAFSAEALMNDPERSPVHEYVFEAVTGLILAAADAMDDSD
tara:strand:- start:944 stop:1249 length:306 start_codon:yes stop_codon:yes gene_type:complete